MPSGIICVIGHGLQWRDVPPERLMIDSTHLEAHRTAASLLQQALAHLLPT